ncbi:MAG: TIGR00341 family protein [Henriciella sp.]
MAEENSSPARPFRVLRVQYRRFLRRMSNSIDHAEVISHVRSEGMLSGRYIFMIVMSCAIAILGLLLSSPAVVIGAMLISPLMGPIMLMGFSLSILDWPALRRGMISMGCGTLAAIAIAFLITLASPLSEATPEILARTRPNFFDLLVAVFSGLAGGYAVINRKGETIVGVAIATALMPPLAVTGFGLAVGSASIAGGSFFLFMTNLLAIALSVTILSRIYSFGARYGSKSTLWQTALVVSVFAALSIPLGFALRDIAYETRVLNLVKSSLLQPFEEGDARVADVAVAFPKDAELSVEATIRTRQPVAGAETLLAEKLSAELGRPVLVNLDQVIVDEDKELEVESFMRLADSSIGVPLREEISRLESLTRETQTEAALRSAISFDYTAADIQPAALSATILAAPSADLSLSAYRTIEAGMSNNFPNWTIEVVPPISELPLIAFETGSDEISAEGESVLGDSVWALRRWGVPTVEVVGYASTSGELQRFDNQSLAFRRAASVSSRLEELGFTASPIGEYRAFRQTVDERELGYRRFQSVIIRPTQ